RHTRWPRDWSSDVCSSDLFHTAAARSDRVRAVATFHGGGLVTKDPNSPHLLIPKTKASFLVAIARNDDQKQPDAKDVLKATFAEIGRASCRERRVDRGDRG